MAVPFAQRRNNFSRKHEFSLGHSEHESSVSKGSRGFVKLGLELKRQTGTEVTN